jgi:hypothetical protein
MKEPHIAAFRRRALAMTERCLPMIIRQTPYERLDELIAALQWFGCPEAMQLKAPEDYGRVPGLSLEEAQALVRLRVQRNDPYLLLHDLEPDARPPAPAS